MKLVVLVLFLWACAPVHGHLHFCEHDHSQGFMEHVHDEDLKECRDYDQTADLKGATRVE